MPSFLEHAINIIRQHAQDALEESLGDLASRLDLAAHAYAIACKIPGQPGTSPFTLTAKRIPKLGQLQNIVESLADLPPEMSIGDLYARLVDLLKTIETELARTPARWESLPARTILDEHGPCQLSGEVLHRFCATNALKALREKRSSHGAQPPPPILQPSEHPSRQLDRLRMYWRSDAQGPRVVARQPDDSMSYFASGSGDELRGDTGCRILLCPLAGPFNPEFEVLDEGLHFRARGANSVASLEELHTTLSAIVAAAREQQLHLIAFPELMICEETRSHLERLLKDDPLEPCPHGILTGSFHVWRESTAKMVDYVANESLLFDHLGRILLRHEKRGKFGIHPELARRPSRFFPQAFPVPAEVKEIRERIAHGGSIEVLETALGRLAIAICADCIVPDHTSLLSFLSDVSPDLLLIAAMTPETKRFETVMSDLAEAGVTSILVNAHCILGEPPPETAAVDSSTVEKEPSLLAAVNIGLFEPPGAPPTRIRWRLGAAEPEARYFKPHDFDKGWRPVSGAPAESGVSLLERDGQQLGLVVDLGIHARWSR